jgi:hypothetical protein
MVRHGGSAIASLAVCTAVSRVIGGESTRYFTQPSGRVVALTIRTTVPGPFATDDELAMWRFGDTPEVGLTIIRDRKFADPRFGRKVTVATSAY